MGCGWGLTLNCPRRIKGTGMDRQFNELAPSLKPAKDGRFKILDMKKTEDELKIIIGTGEPPAAHTHFHFRGVKDFDTFIFGGEERRTRPAVNHFHGAPLAASKLSSGGTRGPLSPTVTHAWSQKLLSNRAHMLPAGRSPSMVSTPASEPARKV